MDIQKLRADARAQKQNPFEYIQKFVIEELIHVYPDSVKETDYYLPKVLINIYSKTGTQFIIITDEWECFLIEDKDAETGIKQIKEKRYQGKLKKYLDNIVLVSIYYDKETKKHTCIIEYLNS